MTGAGPRAWLLSRVEIWALLVKKKVGLSQREPTQARELEEEMEH